MHKEVTVEVGGTTYNVTCACTPEEKEQGLQKVDQLDANEGMLFVYEEPSEVSFWMKDTHIALDIVFIDEYGEVVAVHKGEPMNEEKVFEGEDILYVLEVNQGSDIQVGDDVEIEGLDEEGTKMHVLDEEGGTQMELKGGERIFSRVNTKTLVRLAKRATETRSESDYKRLGRKVFEYLNVQNNKDDDYVDLPE